MPTKSKPLSKAQYSALRASVARSLTSGRRVGGRGAYTYSAPGPIGRLGRNIGSALGAGVGFAKGGPLGAYMGGQVGEYVGGLAHYPARLLGSGAYRKRRVTGRGMYNMNGSTMSQSVPRFGKGAEETIIEYREYLGDIISSSSANTFKIQSFPIQPGMAQSFPWLAPVAANFQMYQLQQCLYEFKTFSADALNSTNTALGAVIGAVDYDASSQAFTTRQQMENSAFSMSAKPSECFIVPIECSTRQSFSGNKLYIRTGNVPTNSDIKTYDVGTLYIASTGCQGTSVNLGSLYVSYRIKLFKPVQLPHGILSLGAWIQGGGTINTSNIFGTVPVKNFDDFGITISGNVVTFPAGVLPQKSVIQFLYTAVGSSTANVTGPELAASTNFSGLNTYAGASAFFASPSGAAATTNGCGVFYILGYTSLTGAAATLTFTEGVLPASPGVSLQIFTIDSSPYSF